MSYEQGTFEDKLSKFIMSEFCIPLANTMRKEMNLEITGDKIYSLLGYNKLPSTFSNPPTPNNSVAPPFTQNGIKKTLNKKPKCKGVKSRGDHMGEPCDKNAMEGSDFCSSHQPKIKSTTSSPAKSNGEVSGMGSQPTHMGTLSVGEMVYFYEKKNCFLTKKSTTSDDYIVIGIYTPNEDRTPSLNERGVPNLRKILTSDELEVASFMGFIVSDDLKDNEKKLKIETIKINPESNIKLQGENGEVDNYLDSIKDSMRKLSE